MPKTNKTKRSTKRTQFSKTQRKKPTKNILVGKVYADWCGYCQELKPEWEKMKHKIQQNMGRSLHNVKITFHEMGDTEENTRNNIRVHDLVHHFNEVKKVHVEINGFPTIFKVCRKRIEYYEGEKTANALYTWVTKGC